MFCQQICHVLQRTQLFQRDETHLAHMLNRHRLHLHVFRSAPWSKPLHDGFGAASVRPDFNFERSCSLVFHKCFKYNASMQPFVIALASDSAEDSDSVACVTDHYRTVKDGPTANAPPDVEHLVFGCPAQSGSTVTWVTSSSLPTQGKSSTPR